jgi:hypothetical protein
MEAKKISLADEQTDDSSKDLPYKRILDILTDPDGPKTCKLLSELSTMTGIEDEKNIKK